MFQSWTNLLKVSFQNIWWGIAGFLPRFLFALIVFLVGWIVGMLAGKGVAHILRIIRLDTTLRGTELERTIERGGFKLDIAAFIGGLVKWFVIVVFLVAAFDILELTQVTNFLQSVVLVYLPQVIVAVLMLVVAAIVADVMYRIVQGSAKAARIQSAHFLANITRWAIWIFGILAALFQLGIAAPFVQTLFTGVIIAISLAVGLAFGLGGQQVAGEYLAKLKREIEDHSHM